MQLADHSFRGRELTSVVIHQESSNRIISGNGLNDDNEDVEVVVISAQNGVAHLEAAEAKQRRLSESDIFTQKKPQNMAHVLEARPSEQSASGPNNEEKQPRCQIEAEKAETKSLA